MNTRQVRPAAPQATEIIGRTREINAVIEAIGATGTHVLHFVGSAGMGKTRQLREVSHLYQGRKFGLPSAKKNQDFEWLGLIDLYHADLHTSSLIEKQIIERIDPNFKSRRALSPFRNYLDKRDNFDKQRQQGFVTDSERAKLRSAFVHDYNTWATNHRAVIAFDTLEVIVHEEDPAFRICEGAAAHADILSWLLEILPQLQNTVFLLANRHVDSFPLEAVFEKSFRDAGVKHYELFELKPLSQEDSEKYLDDIFKQRPDVKRQFEEPGYTLADIAHEIWQYTTGVPVLMSLVLDLAAFGKIAALRRIRTESPESLTRVKQLLVEELEKIEPPIWHTLRCLNVARKGLTVDLFHHLMKEDGWNLEVCTRELDRLKEATFVKFRAETSAFFLHDALYEMFDGIKPFPLADPGSLLPRIIHFYESKIAFCEQDLKNGRLALQELNRQIRTDEAITNESTIQHDNQRSRLLNNLDGQKREWQRLQIELVYYMLWSNPLKGFEHLIKLYNEALQAREFGFDVRLHDELVRYLGSKLYEEDKSAQHLLPLERFHRHCALRWLKIHLARGDFKRLQRVANRLLKVRRPPLGGAEAESDLLYQAEIRLGAAGALNLLSKGLEAEEKLSEALVLLESTRGQRNYTRWRRGRLIGQAHNRLGYIYRISQRYSASVEEYQKAVALFRKLDIKDEQANTLNNLAYVRSVRGEVYSAKNLVEDAQGLREELGQIYPLAFSLMTTGAVYTVADDPESAVPRFEQASAIFSDMNNARGLGMAYTGLGRTKRKLGAKQTREQNLYYSFEQLQQIFRESESLLQKAYNIFGGDSPLVSEPYRLWEVLNEMGSLYTDWAALLRQYRQKDIIDAKFRLSIDYQKRAVNLARHSKLTLQLLDSYDDLAQTYADWGKLDQAQNYLDKAYESVPKEYKLAVGQGFGKILLPVDGYWLVMGKYHLQQAIWSFAKTERAKMTSIEKDRLLIDAVRNFALATAYFQRFSPQHPYMDVTMRAMYKRFKTLNIDRLEKLRREVQSVARQYRVKLDTLVKTLDDTLGRLSS